MILPAPWASMCRPAAWARIQTASRLTASTWSQSSRGNSSAGWRRCAPALLTRMSSPPRASTARSTRACACGPVRQVHLQGNGAHLPRRRRSTRSGRPAMATSRAACDQRLGHGPAQACAPPRHQRPFALNGEQVGRSIASCPCCPLPQVQLVCLASHGLFLHLNCRRAPPLGGRRPRRRLAQASSKRCANRSRARGR